LSGLADLEAIDLVSKAPDATAIISAMCFDTSSNYSGYGESKMFKVNFSSFNKCGAVEFRQHDIQKHSSSVFTFGF
jgi:hypothetical protein